MYPTIKDIYDRLDSYAPFASAESWDNVGILAGSGCRTIKRVMLALDLTNDSIDEAVKCGIDLIITHHPVMFHARQNICEDNYEGAMLSRLIRADIALIAAHTNLDRAEHGVAQSLSEILGLCNSEVCADGFMRMGQLYCNDGMSFGDFSKYVSRKLNTQVRLYGNRSKQIKKCVVCPGSGGSFSPEVQTLQPDCYLSGEVGHHNALDLNEQGICVLEVGHYESERIILPVLEEYLQSQSKVLKWDIVISISQYIPFEK